MPNAGENYTDYTVLEHEVVKIDSLKPLQAVGTGYSREGVRGDLTLATAGEVGEVLARLQQGTLDIDLVREGVGV